MKGKLKEISKSPEYANFENALRKVLSVPKAVVMAEVERLHKPRKQRKPKTSASDHASRDSEG